MNKYFKLLALIIVGTFMAGCSPFALVNSETYNNADLADYSTFRIVTPDQTNHLPPGMEMVTYYNIAAAIREQMVDRGYTEDPNSPLLINIGLTVHNEIETAPAYPSGAPLPPPPPPVYGGFRPYWIYPRQFYYPPSYYSNAQVITGMYKEGVLTMDFVNIDQKIPLYSASVATIINQGTGQFRNLQGIAQAVQTLFSKFPVPLLPQYRNR